MLWGLLLDHRPDAADCRNYYNILDNGCWGGILSCRDTCTHVDTCFVDKRDTCNTGHANGTRSATDQAPKVSSRLTGVDALPLLLADERFVVFK